MLHEREQASNSVSTWLEQLSNKISSYWHLKLIVLGYMQGELQISDLEAEGLDTEQPKKKRQLVIPVCFGLLVVLHLAATISLAIIGAPPVEYYGELALLASWALILVRFKTPFLIYRTQFLTTIFSRLQAEFPFSVRPALCLVICSNGGTELNWS